MSMLCDVTRKIKKLGFSTVSPCCFSARNELWQHLSMFYVTGGIFKPITLNN